MTVAEKVAVNNSVPSLNTNNWLIVKKLPHQFTLQHKETGTKRNVPVTPNK